MSKAADSRPLRMTRLELLALLAGRILAVQARDRAMLICFDGPDLSGKTTLTTDLCREITARRQRVVVVHVDDFLQDPWIRYRRGEFSPVGFYQDFFDYSALRQLVLLPARSGVSVTYTRESRQPSATSPVLIAIEPQDIVLVEGLFLLRPELRGCFDVVVRLEIPATLMLERALDRDVPTLGSGDYVRRHYETQVIPARLMYEKLARPNAYADIVIENADIEAPLVKKMRWFRTADPLSAEGGRDLSQS